LIKTLELKDPNSCLNKAADDEPLFVLRAKDVLADKAILYWAHLARSIHEPDKVTEAISLARRMVEWRDSQK
jgi:hypothetical protein